MVWRVDTEIHLCFECNSSCSPQVKSKTDNFETAKWKVFNKVSRLYSDRNDNCLGECLSIAYVINMKRSQTIKKETDIGNVPGITLGKN